jgi:hypothetical protein
MKRRNFFQTLAAAPAVTALVAQQQPASELPKLETSTSDAAAEILPHFFNADQMSALRKLSDTLQPSLHGTVGALDAKTPEFLDFLIGESSSDRQQVYRAGLDALNAQSKNQYQKAFADLDAAQAAAILAPLRQPWSFEPLTDPLARFLHTAKADIRTATVNSREYNSAGGASGRRFGSQGLYWLSLD